MQPVRSAAVQMRVQDTGDASSPFAAQSTEDQSDGRGGVNSPHAGDDSCVRRECVHRYRFVSSFQIGLLSCAATYRAFKPPSLIVFISALDVELLIYGINISFGIHFILQGGLLTVGTEAFLDQERVWW